MANNQRILLRILKEIGREYQFQIIEHGDGWIVELIHHRKSLFIHGYNFPNNKASAAKLCDDKTALSNILAVKKIPVVQHNYFMNPNSPYHTDTNWKRKTVSLFKKYKQLVVKPNNGTGGDCVFKVSTISELNDAVKKVFARFDAMAISPFMEVEQEYRLIVLDGEIELAYLKKRKCNEWRHNLQLGAIPITIENQHVLSLLSKLALSAVKATGIDFASVDIIQIGDTFQILEINSGVMLERFATYSKTNYQIAKRIYWKAITNR